MCTLKDSMSIKVHAQINLNLPFCFDVFHALPCVIFYLVVRLPDAETAKPTKSRGAGVHQCTNNPKANKNVEMITKLAFNMCPHTLIYSMCIDTIQTESSLSTKNIGESQDGKISKRKKRGA